MNRQMNHKTTIIEVIGHECSQRDRRVYSQGESRLAAFEGRAKGIGEINAPFIYSCATFHWFSNACHTGYTKCIKFELKFSIILQE